MKRGFSMNRLCYLVLFSVVLNGCGGKQVSTDPAGNNLDEPDRVLFERAMSDLNKSKFSVARLTLQTLINVYPDSEYLEQGMYYLAESFYREGTTAGYAQAEAQFKDFITFFPQGDLTDDAQLLVAMTHVRQLEKPDRDPSQALLAEAELKAMIAGYPDSSLLADAKQKLRDVQEVLAQGVLGIANHYFRQKVYHASTARYREIVDNYPDSILVPNALYMLAESLRLNNNEPESAIYYARLVSDYPTAEAVNDAKARLTELKQPIPEPNPVAIAMPRSGPDPIRELSTTYLVSSTAGRTYPQTRPAL